MFYCRELESHRLKIHVELEFHKLETYVAKTNYTLANRTRAFKARFVYQTRDATIINHF